MAGKNGHIAEPGGYARDHAGTIGAGIFPMVEGHRSWPTARCQGCQGVGRVRLDGLKQMVVCPHCGGTSEAAAKLPMPHFAPFRATVTGTFDV